jgi:tripartite-type tricarboxylate transporter receptor subunit TctC
MRVARALLATAVLATFFAAPAPAAAQAADAAAAARYPDRPVRMVVPFAPAGTADIVARLVAQCMAPGLGQPVVVENRAGAGGTVGSEAVAKAAPDGYTLALHTVSSAVLNSFLYRRLPYDARRDFSAVSQVGQSPNVLVVRPGLPANSVRELIALLKREPGRYSYGSSGNGTILHLSAALFATMAGVEATHVPYRGAGPALNDLLAGQVDFMIDVIPALLPHIQEGRLRALGVSTAERVPLLPEVPTIAEAALPGYETYIWHGLFAPARTPRPVVDRVAAEAVKAVNDPDCRRRMVELGVDPVGSGPAEFEAFWDRQIAYWGPVVRASGATLD